MTGYRSLVLRVTEWETPDGATEEHTLRASIDAGEVTLWHRTEVRKGARSIDDGPAIELHPEEMAALVAIWQEATA